MSGQVSRGSAGEYQADELAGVAGLNWRVGKHFTSPSIFANCEETGTCVVFITINAIISNNIIIFIIPITVTTKKDPITSVFQPTILRSLMEFIRFNLKGKTNSASSLVPRDGWEEIETS